MTTQTANGHGASAVRDTLANFTQREDALIQKLRAAGISLADLPERLGNWRLWVGDSAIYLSELRTFVNSATREKAA